MIMQIKGDMVRPALVYGAERKVQEYNENATMDVQSYEAGQYKKWKNKVDTTKLGEIAKKFQERSLK